MSGIMMSLANNATIIPVANGSMNFHATSFEILNMSSAAMGTSSTDVTIEFWMRPNVFVDPLGVFSWYAEGVGQMVINYAGGSLTVTTPANGQISYAVAPNVWTYICTGNFNGVTQLTVNGVNRGSSNTANYTWSTGLNVGYDGYPFDGLITDFRISNADVNGIGSGGGCSIPTQPLTATPGTTILLLSAATPATVNTDTSGNNAFVSPNALPTWSPLTPY